ncbi:MAG: ABC transporter ATP-binding protein [Propionibacteriaceae bacterium]
MPGMGAAARALTRDQSVKHHRLAKGTWPRVLSYAKPFSSLIVASVLLSILGSFLDIVPPLLLKEILDKGVLGKNPTLVIVLAGIVAVVAVLAAVTNLTDRWCSSRIGEGLIYQLRLQVFDHVTAMPIAFFSRTHTGKLVSRIHADVTGAQRAFTATLSNVVSSLIKLILVLIAMLSLNPWLTVLSVILLPLFMIPARIVGRQLADLTRDAATYNGDVSATMTERFAVSGALLVKLFGRSGDEHNLFAEKAGVLRDTGIKTAMVQRFFIVMMTLVAALASAMVYGVGGLWTAAGEMSVGTLTALAALLSQLYGPLINLTNTRVDIMSAMVSFERVFEVLDLAPMVAEKPNAVSLQGPASIEFDRVSFTYPAADLVSLASLESTVVADEKLSEQVIHEVSFRVEPGQTVALVGPSGAGKTTLTHLLARLYDPTSGVIRIGGQDISDVTLASLQASLGYVTQDAHMFHDTIRHNLSYARLEVTEEEMWQALESAHIADLVRRLPDGLDTMVGERGYRLSGGERQRLAIARLLVKAPPIIVLDEATAHLDSESEAAVHAAFDHTMAHHTSLVIAHRLSTIRNADQIVVVKQGRIVEHGRHSELLAAGGIYAELHDRGSVST